MWWWMLRAGDAGDIAGGEVWRKEAETEGGMGDRGFYTQEGCGCTRGDGRPGPACYACSKWCRDGLGLDLESMLAWDNEDG